jgi:hypothetical protein
VSAPPEETSTNRPAVGTGDRHIASRRAITKYDSLPEIISIREVYSDLGKGRFPSALHLSAGSQATGLIVIRIEGVFVLSFLTVDVCGLGRDRFVGKKPD